MSHCDTLVSRVTVQCHTCYSSMSRASYFVNFDLNPTDFWSIEIGHSTRVTL